MKTLLTGYVWLLGMVCLAACSKDDASADAARCKSLPVSSEEELLIDPEGTELTGTDAARVAALFMLREHPGAAVKKPAQTLPVEGPQGDIPAYAVNFRDGGYVVVSSTKKYLPIVAFSERGNIRAVDFDGNGLKLWTQNLSAEVSRAKRTLTVDSPEYADVRALWREYERMPAVAAASGGYGTYYWYLQHRDAMMTEIGSCNIDRTNFWYTASTYGVHYDTDYYERIFKEEDRVLAIQYAGESVPPAFFWGEGPVRTMSVTEVKTLTANDMGPKLSAALVPMADEGAVRCDAQAVVRRLETVGFERVEDAGGIEAAVAAEVAAQRPVCVVGFDASGTGHAWVCDGYSVANSVRKIKAYHLLDRTHGDFTTSPYSSFLEKTKTVNSAAFMHVDWNRPAAGETAGTALQGVTGWFRWVFGPDADAAMTVLRTGE